MWASTVSNVVQAHCVRWGRSSTSPTASSATSGAASASSSGCAAAPTTLLVLLRRLLALVRHPTQLFLCGCTAGDEQRNGSHVDVVGQYLKLALEMVPRLRFEWFGGGLASDGAAGSIAVEPVLPCLLLGLVSATVNLGHAARRHNERTAHAQHSCTQCSKPIASEAAVTCARSRT